MNFPLKLDIQYFAAPGAQGLRTETVDHFIVDAGAVYLNYELPTERLLGATRGGNTFTIEQDVREIEIDGAPGPVKGARRIIEVRPRMSTNLLEITRENLLMAIPGAVSVPLPDAAAATHDSITRSRNITNADYIENVALVGTVSGSDEPIIIILENALQDENFEIGTEDRDESVLEVQFTGHFDAANMGREPWEIRYPRITGLQSGVVPAAGV